VEHRTLVHSVLEGTTSDPISQAATSEVPWTLKVIQRLRYAADKTWQVGAVATSTEFLSLGSKEVLELVLLAVELVKLQK